MILYKLRIESVPPEHLNEEGLIGFSNYCCYGTIGKKSLVEKHFVAEFKKRER